MTIPEALKDKSRKILILKPVHRNGRLIHCKAASYGEQELDLVFGNENTETFKIQKVKQSGQKTTIKTLNDKFVLLEWENQDLARQNLLRRHE